MNKWITNEINGNLSFCNCILSILKDAYRVDVAVSYVLLSGWELLEPRLKSMPRGSVRLLITDQLNITQPEALRRALALGINLRNFDGRFYHPKTYIAYGKKGGPKIGILGSANISESGLTKSVEAGVMTKDKVLLNEMKLWFEGMFTDNTLSKKINRKWIDKLEIEWLQAAKKRAKGVKLRAPSRKRKRAKRAVSLEENEILEDIFATIRQPIGNLSFDQAANNIRNLDRAHNVLKRFPRVNPKEKSELHLLGFMNEDGLTELGKNGKLAKNIQTLALAWCKWVANQTDDELAKFNIRLISFKNSATQFWKLKPEVSNFFLDNLHSQNDKGLLQTIELLCNGSKVSLGLSLADLKVIAPKIIEGTQFSEFVGKRVQGYLNNKGSRSWSGDDRKIILIAWKKAASKKKN
ncbi:MAG: hypothetical protein NPINA01_32100 [Nitrospinaceae bacterium]|nr:MAG: hypothetical protein NPINA01_32100 [Nitrospinaceae bacterium]